MRPEVAAPFDWTQHPEAFTGPFYNMVRPTGTPGPMPGNQEMLAGIQNLVMEDTFVDWISDRAKVEEISTTFDDVMQS